MKAVNIKLSLAENVKSFVNIASRYSYDIEPSDWEISSRYIGWTLEPIFAFIIFILGLQ